MRSRSTGSGPTLPWWRRLLGSRSAAAPSVRRDPGPSTRQLASNSPSQALAEQFQRTQIQQAARNALLRLGLHARACEVVVRRGHPAPDGRPTYFLLVRINEWRADILLRSKQIESRIQQAVERLYPVRLSHVFWRMSAQVPTPFDLNGNVDVPLPEGTPNVAPAEDETPTLPPSAPGDMPSGWSSQTDWGSIEATPSRLPQGPR